MLFFIEWEKKKTKQQTTAAASEKRRKKENEKRQEHCDNLNAGKGVREDKLQCLNK